MIPTRKAQGHVAAPIVIFCVTLASVAIADSGSAEAPQSEAWYKIATGIIAIPAAILGLLFSFRVLRKTTLESRKLELEIREKQVALGEPGVDQSAPGVVAGIIAGPIGDMHRGLLLVVRFVILDLTIRLWDLVPSAFGYLTGSIPYALLLIVGEDRINALKPTSLPFIATFMFPKVVSFGFSVVYWTMVFGFGWPLLKDTCRYLGIPMDGFFDLPFLGRRRTHASTTGDPGSQDGA